MTYKVVSKRLPFAMGSVLSAYDLQGCNIEALLYAGHLTVVEEKKPRKAAVITAQEPEEQE
jgi:hypothetical protein